MSDGKDREDYMKEVKTKKIDVRVTPEEKELIKAQATAYDLTVSELIRKALIKMNLIKEEGK